MKNIVCILILFLCTHSMYAMGLGDWIYHTDKGSTIEDPGGGIRLSTNKNDELEHLKKWYFYNKGVMNILLVNIDQT